MPRTVNLQFKATADRTYAQGNFRPRRKYEHRHPYDQFPDFPNQQGITHGLEVRPNNIIGVEFIGLFPGYNSAGVECQYRAFAVTLLGGKRVAGYSHDDDRYVLCLHTEYIAAE